MSHPNTLFILTSNSYIENKFGDSEVLLLGLPGEVTSSEKFIKILCSGFRATLKFSNSEGSPEFAAENF